jgi:orotate phosphoribosyltransferase
MDPVARLVGVRTGHFPFESGHHSDLWMDLETLCLEPAVVQSMAVELAARLKPHAIEMVCGPLNEGAFVALLTASALGCQFAYTERFAPDVPSAALFPVEYRLPKPLRTAARGRRVAIVNDVSSAGSAVKGTFADLHLHGAQVVAIASLVVLGDAMKTFAAQKQLPLVSLAERALNMWTPAECPLCADGVPLEATAPVS